MILCGTRTTLLAYCNTYPISRSAPFPSIPAAEVDLLVQVTNRPVDEFTRKTGALIRLLELVR